ncbi:MAG: 2-C-methyl-D-erythritol 2,4-cyclodiphosphate synthase [Candidatus Moraniibacteriota bacterium]
MFRVGLGQDSHRFSENQNKKLILGGIEIEGEKGLEGNSDADVILHAICAAIEQALGRVNFSVYADEMFKNGITDSTEYLKIALSHIEEDSYAINNLGISIEAKKPKILSIEDRLKINLAEILKIEKNRIGINATSGEELTAFGKGKGIQVFVIISLIKNERNQN